MEELLKIEAVAKTESNKDSNAGSKITGIAYSGGSFGQTWDGRPIVLNLAGLEFASQIPLMDTHANAIQSKLGEVSAIVVDNQLFIEGAITSQSAGAKLVVEEGKRSDWQLSMGAEIIEKKEVKAGDTVEINGRQFTGPLINVVRAKLREVSVVAIGADADTNLKIAAKFNLSINSTGEIKMGKEKEVVDVKASAKQEVVEAAIKEVAPAVKEVKAELPTQEVKTAVNNLQNVEEAAQNAIRAERTRVSEIQAICNGEFSDLEKEAISAGWDLNATRDKVLEKIRAERPATGPNINVSSDKSISQKSIEAALCMRSGISAEQLLSSKSFDEKSIELGMRDMDLSLRDVVKESLRLSGQAVPRSVDNTAIQAAFSTVSLPGILSNVANKTLAQSYASTPVTAFKFCSVGNLTDFKEADRYRLTDVGDLKPVAADGEIKEGGLSEESATNQLETYAKKFCLTRKMIINDDLGAFTKVPAAMGNRAARLIDQLFFARLLANPTQADTNALFSAAHNNYLSGATTNLGKVGLEAGIEKFLNQKDSDGSPINVEPRYLLVPTKLKFTALELIKGVSLIASGDTDTLRPAYNALSDENIEVVSSPYLTDATGWYLFGNPNQVDTFEIGFLKGKRTPTIERGDTDFNTLGMWFRVFFDVGVREQDHRGMVYSKGKA